MMFLVTGSTAYGFGGVWYRVILAAVCAAFLALGGFYLDYVADWKKDKISGKLTNPIAAGIILPLLGIVITIGGVLISGVLAYLIKPVALIPLAWVIILIGGMAVGILDKPILRALSLGAIQGLYVLIGGIASDNFGIGVILTGLFLFFAMTGGRVMGDVRDLPHDQKTDIQTIPKKYGLVWARIFLVINELFAYIIALLVFFMGGLKIGYAYCVIGIIVFGIIINTIFIIKTTPKVADITNKLSLGVLGMLFVIGMILGRK